MLTQLVQMIVTFFFLRITEDPSVLSVVPTVSAHKPLDLPSAQGVGVALPSASGVGVTQAYSHQSLEQQQQQQQQQSSAGGVATDVGRIDTVEIKDAPLEGPPG